MALPHTWIDASGLHALGCIYSVDVAVLQADMEPALLGPSIKGQSFGTAMVAVAMVNDMHFWALLPRVLEADMDVTTHLAADDESVWAQHLVPCSPAPAAKRPRVGSSIHLVDEHNDGDDAHSSKFTMLEPNLVADELVDVEMQICCELRGWNPFAAPSAALVAALQHKVRMCRASESTVPAIGECRRRQKAVEQLLLESAAEHAAAANMSPGFIYRRAAKWHLQKKTSILQVHDKRATTALEDIKVFKDIHMGAISSALEKGCGRWEKPHKCLNQFKANPDLMRNWRVLWYSLPPAMRRESLLVMCKEAQKAHEKSDMRSAWRLHYKVLGIDVCEDAFCVITGIGRSSLTQARKAAVAGHQSSLSRSELPLHLAILPGSKPLVYLDARKWIETYARDHGEHDPRHLEYFLPAGRRHFYYLLYNHDRKTQNTESASETVFGLCWRTECPHIKINTSVNPFLKCGLCTYMKQQIDLTPRSDVTLLNALKERMGIHLSFQSSQRLAENRKEEEADQSDGNKWAHHIDRMDQVKTIFPSLHSQASTQWFKGGARVKCSIIGGYWHGIRNAHFVIRTAFDDFATGSENQASALLQNLHDAGLQAGFLPLEWFVGADNTPKETKNQWVIFFFAWLLCALRTTRLWCAEEGFLIVGHTHGKDDRFFSMIGHVTAGKSYITREDMLHIITTELKKWTIRCGHLYTVWKWKDVVSVVPLPALHGLHNCHAFQIFRAGGVHLRWKQYMTDETWSKSIVLVEPHHVPTLAAWRPEAIAPELAGKQAMLAFADKLELFLADTHQSLEKYKGALHALRGTMMHQMEFQRGPSVDAIVADLISVGQKEPVKQSNATNADAALGDQLCQFFPGADVPGFPLDTLVGTSTRDGKKPAPPPDFLIIGSLYSVNFLFPSVVLSSGACMD